MVAEGRQKEGNGGATVDEERARVSGRERARALVAATAGATSGQEGRLAA